MNSLLEYAESLVRPVQVLVIDGHEGVCQRIKKALSVYECEVGCAECGFTGLECLQNSVYDLIFLGVPLVGSQISALEVVKGIEKFQPTASVVVTTKTPEDPEVGAIMRHNVYTFMVRNGSFNEDHVRAIFHQLNLRLRRADDTQPDVKIKFVS